MVKSAAVNPAMPVDAQIEFIARDVAIEGMLRGIFEGICMLMPAGDRERFRNHVAGEVERMISNVDLEEYGVLADPARQRAIRWSRNVLINVAVKPTATQDNIIPKPEADSPES